MRRLVVLALVIIAVSTPAVLVGCDKNASGNTSISSKDSVPKVIVYVNDATRTKNEQPPIVSYIKERLTNNSEFEIIDDMKQANHIFAITYMPLKKVNQALGINYVVISETFVDMKTRTIRSNITYQPANELEKAVDEILIPDFKEHALASVAKN